MHGSRQNWETALDHPKRPISRLRAAAPEMMKIAVGKEERPPELDTFAAAFAVAGEDQERTADEKTTILLKWFLSNPDVEKARSEFNRAQKIEEEIPS
jgi:hypothetical protein